MTTTGTDNTEFRENVQHLNPESRLIRLAGQVQGVGFRPFVYRLALKRHLKGWVKNLTGEVEILIQGSIVDINMFCKEIIDLAPPTAIPQLINQQDVLQQRFDSFRICESTGAIDETSASPSINIPPDYFTCEECLQELNNPNDRRYRFPFINCTQCGPRYTLIETLPYDRVNTSMSEFTLCADCEQEYHDPARRRFHAEPIACKSCGPVLQYKKTNIRASDTEDIRDNAKTIAAALTDLRDGKIVAIKGVGGYHLACDATNDKAIKRLRKNKNRPHKPLAVMFPETGGDLNHISQNVVISDIEEDLLRSSVRPIVLCRKSTSSRLSGLIAPGFSDIGVLLPYTPLHHILLNDIQKPLVMTSANISGEPVLINNVETALQTIADSYVHHNRGIFRHADDSVFRVIDNKVRAIRLGRGKAPIEIELPFTLDKPMIATGGHMNNSIAMAWDNRVVVSPHIGDLGSPRSQQVFEKTIADLQSLYKVDVSNFVCDAHPDYASTRWAMSYAHVKVYHHHAHASALVAEASDKKKWANQGNWLVFTWDGSGYGKDNTLWGGEALLGKPGQWKRAASFEPFLLPGGEKAANELWRTALSLCWQTQQLWAPDPSILDDEKQKLLNTAWKKKFNCPQTSSAGRLFDGAAAILGLVTKASFQGQGPMLLESIASNSFDTDSPVLHNDYLVDMTMTLDNSGILRADWSPLLQMLLDPSTKYDKSTRAYCFHASMANSIVQQAIHLRKQHGNLSIGLTGGVFQNKLLTEMALAELRKHQFAVFMPERIPVNDGGLSYGQIIEACANR